MKIMECLGHGRQGRIKVLGSEGAIPEKSTGKYQGQGQKRPIGFGVGITQHTVFIGYGLKKAT